MKKKISLLAMLAIGATTLGYGIVIANGDPPIVELGDQLFKDTNLSINSNQSCMSCHHPSAGFQDPDNRVMPAEFPVSEGSIHGLFGGRNAPSAAFASSSPLFHFDPDEELFFGGMFWDGRATGWALGDPLADQAQGPFGNPVEMALDPNNVAAEVIQRVEASAYAELFEDVFGPDAFEDVDEAFNNVARAIAAFERSKNLIDYKSKFDKFWSEQGGDVSSFGLNPDGSYAGLPDGFNSRVFTLEEAEGLALFNATDKGNCAACHVTTNDGGNPPVFTDFSYDNIGVPVNPQIAVLAGDQPIDYGLGAMVLQLNTACDVVDGFNCDKYFRDACGQLTDQQKKSECKKNLPGAVYLPDGLGGKTFVYVSEAGKVKVPTLRNVGRSAPYAHNGFFVTLEEITHFYNTRDVEDWPAPEVALNVNDAELGDLGLTAEEETAIVAFMKTL